jgi:hypothetical protein
VFALMSLSSPGSALRFAYAQELDEFVYLPFIAANVPETTSTPTQTATAGPSSTPTDTATAGPSPTATDTATAGPSPTATETSTPTDTATAGPSPTATETSTPTDTATAGPSPTATDTPTETSTPTEANTPTETSTPTETNTPTETATETSTPTETATATLEPLPEIQNGDFESGPGAGWTETSSSDFSTFIYNVSEISFINARSGDWLAWLAGANDEMSEISQSITLPSGRAPNLLYYYQVRSQEADCGDDVFEVRVDGTAVDTMNLCANVNSWTSGSMDLSTYAGQTITISFYVSTNGTQTSSLFLDDVSLAEQN